MAQINSRSRKQEIDPLDAVMKGLTIAHQVYGIRANMQSLEDAKADRDAKDKAQKTAEAERKRIASNQLYRNEILDRQKDGIEFSDTETPGSVMVQPVAADGTPEGMPLYAFKKKVEARPSYEKISDVVQGGKRGHILRNLDTGKEDFYEAYAEPKKDEKETFSLIANSIQNGIPGTWRINNKTGEKEFFEGAPKAPPATSTANKKTAESLSGDIARKVSAVHLIDEQLRSFKDAYAKGDEALAVKVGQGMLKILNSDVGSDAVGAEESKRLGSFLEYKIANFTGPGSFFGRDLDKFFSQASTKVGAIKQAIAKDRESAKALLADQELQFEQTDTTLPEFGSAKQNPGEANAQGKDNWADLEAMNWLEANPNDPMAPEIRKKLQSKGFK